MPADDSAMIEGAIGDVSRIAYRSGGKQGRPAPAPGDRR
jgi:hypothetical protein